MDKEYITKYFRTIGRIQKNVQNAETLDEAITSGVTEILSAFPSDYAIVYYFDEKNKEILRPFHWIGDKDFTACIHKVNKGIIGQVCGTGDAKRLLEYQKGEDQDLDRDFTGIPIRSLICVPFSNKIEDLGCLLLVRTDNKEPFNDDIADVCSIFVDLMSLSIEDNDKIESDWKFNHVILSARDIKKSFKNGDTVTTVLKGVNLDIYEGEFLAILGESGSGKSTFLNIIGGMDKADSGTYQFMEHELSQSSQEELTKFRRDNIGFIFQSYNLISTLTAAQNIDLIGELVEDHLTSDEVLDMVGLNDRKKNYPAQLSGGQQQRVSIARALVKKPKVIFADEPTSALDYSTSIEVLSVLEDVVKAGTTLVMVTHNEEITKMADRVIRMRSGKTYDIKINRHPFKATELVW